MQHRVTGGVIASALSIVLTACGGGGGGTTGGTPPTTSTSSPSPAPTATPTAPPSAFAAVPSNIELMDLSATQTLTLSGGPQNSAYAIDASQCNGIANVTSTATGTYTVSAVALGNCNLIASDGQGDSAAVYVSVTSTTVVVQ